ncbi:MAG: acyltransferase family protein [Aquabacterium sp.]|uniref:acyltransferase family protein n=1 Tax=Aquabacterium sp. TaxID=1872578 RepID=UPI003BCBF1E3
MTPTQKHERTPTHLAQQRTDWVDVAKGVGIIAVVIGHAIGGMIDAGITGKVSLWATAYHLIYTVHMPMFFIISGLFISKRVSGGALIFAKNSTIRLARPYVIWFAISMVAINFAGNTANTPYQVTWQDYLSILWKPGAHFWYIYALMVLNIVSAIILPRYGSAVLLGLSLAAFSLTAELQIPAAFWGATHFGFYYALGVLYGEQSNQPKTTRSLHRSERWMLAVALSFLWCWGASDMLKNNISRWTFSSTDVSLCGAVATLMWCMFVKGQLQRWLSSLGQQSLAIYMMHVLFVAGARITLAQKMHVQDPILIFCVITCLGIFGPLACKWMTDKLGWSDRLGLA